MVILGMEFTVNVKSAAQYQTRGKDSSSHFKTARRELDIQYNAKPCIFDESRSVRNCDETLFCVLVIVIEPMEYD